MTFGKVRRNIRLLRDQIFPAETKGWEEAFPETIRLKPLFDMQDILIEHRFPHEKAQIIDTILSHAGDIYREMTHAYPHYGYVGEKWERLTTWATRPPLSWLQPGDWEEIRNQIQDPSYKAQRDEYLSNLQRLREETLKLPMDPKRSAVMVESLDLIKALIFWFESLDPYAPPRQQLERLTAAVAAYFPREFFEGSQLPPEEYLIVYRGLSDRYHEQVMREGIRPSLGQDKVYTTVDFREGVRFAWAHVKEEGGHPVVYRLRVPVTVFTGEVVYSAGPTGFLMSETIPREYILDWVLVPENLDEVWKLVDRYEAEDIARKSLTTKLLEKIPKVYYSPDMLNIHVKHPSITSMYNISMAPTLELKSRHGPELKQMITEAEREKREIGAMLCRSPSGVHVSRTCYGRRETVTVADCHDGLSPLGSFHTHLGGTEVFSVTDLELAIKKEQLSCLGYTKAGVPMLKCITPKRYYELPSESKAWVKRSLDQAKQDIERATLLFRSAPSQLEAIALSQRAKATLSNIEQLLGAYEVEL